MGATKPSASPDQDVAEQARLLREGRRGVAEWEAGAGALTTQERAAAAALGDRLLAEARKVRPATSAHEAGELDD
ncbi:MAG: hypothetical protein FWH11_12145 [Micrococcales bacterium]|nr:hypothetical protein [Micrococcales bacterium]